MEEEAANSTQPDRWRYLRPQPLNYYLQNARSHRKIGSLATKSFFQLKELLSKEIPLPSAYSMTSSVTGLVKRPFRHVIEKAQEQEAEEKKTEEEFDEAVKQSNEVLAEATTVFPFTLFPDTVTVDRTKLTITQRTFFMSSKVMTIHIEDVLNLSVQVGPFFGSLTIAIKGLTSEDHFSINYFRRKDAIHLKHIIQGHTIARRDNLDYKSMEKEKLIDTLIKLGKDSNP